MMSAGKPIPTMRAIVKACAEHAGLAVTQLLDPGPRAGGDLLAARRRFVVLCRRLRRDVSLVQIGQMLSIDRSTVHHHAEVGEGLVAKDGDEALRLLAIARCLGVAYLPPRRPPDNRRRRGLERTIARLRRELAAAETALAEIEACA